MSTPDFDVAALAQWYRAEYARRTEAVERGEVCIDWALPQFRVSWSEVVAKAEQMGWQRGSPVDLRLALAEILQ